MRTFRAFFRFEYKRFLERRYLIIFIIFTVLVLGATQYGVYQYKNSSEQKQRFLEYENKKLKSFYSYRMYASYGFQLIAAADPFVIFSINSVPFKDLSTQIDSSERLQINSVLQGDKAFKVKKKWFTDFSGMMLFFATFLALFFGLETFHNMEYMKILSSAAGQRRIFTHIVLARLMLLFLLLTVVLLLSYLLILLNGVFIPLLWGLPVFLMVIVLNVWFFFALGALIGTVRSKSTAILLGIFLWFTGIFIIPTVIDTIIDLKSYSITSFYNAQLQKFKILSDFEMYVKKVAGLFKLGEKPTETRIALAHRYWEKDFKEIMVIEKKLQKQMERNISLGQWLSTFFPNTNYLSTTNELSSNGYNGLLDFYRYSMQVKIAFNQKFLEVVYFSGNSDQKVEPFLKEGKNMYQLRMSIPAPLGLGVFLSLLYIFIFFCFTHKGYKSRLFFLPPKEESQFSGQPLWLEKSDFVSFYIENDLFGRQMFNLFSGREAEIRAKGYDYEIKYGSEDLLPVENKTGFLYLLHINKIPGHFAAGDFLTLLTDLVKTGKKRREAIILKYNLASLWKRQFHQLNERQSGAVLLATIEAIDFPVYLVDDVIDKMPLEFIKQLKGILEDLTTKKNALVIFLTNRDFMEKSLRKSRTYFTRSDNWGNIVDTTETLMEDIES
jgi:ABC-type transport system involved in cytochrome c biogenesis ATPase subunit